MSKNQMQAQNPVFFVESAVVKSVDAEKFVVDSPSNGDLEFPRTRPSRKLKPGERIALRYRQTDDGTLCELNHIGGMSNAKLKKGIRGVRTGLGNLAALLRLTYNAACIGMRNDAIQADSRKAALVATATELRLLALLEAEAHRRGLRLAPWRTRKHLMELLAWYAAPTGSEKLQ